jgi:hypothetical protein
VVGCGTWVVEPAGLFLYGYSTAAVSLSFLKFEV